ncbi:MAG: tol-pal system protein YbgF [Porticoccaceae bacterium]
MRNIANLSRMLALPLVLTLPFVQPSYAQQGLEGSGAGNVYHQLQIIQEEMRDLRGMVEELTWELQRLKQRQMDDYQDLDSRLSGGAGSGPAAPGGALPGALSAPAEADPLLSAADRGLGAGGGATSPADAGSEQQSYTAAYELLKNRQIDQAVIAFDTHLKRYPQGPHAANAHYWLGEIYLLQNDLGSAETSFTTVVDNFANDRKAPDAMFKLGRVYHLQGQTAKAKEILNRVAATNSSAAALARAYLQDNF